MPRSAQRAAPRRVPARRRRRAHDPANVLFAAAAENVPAALVRASPTLMVAAVEDLCWRVALLDWAARRPPRTARSRRRAWEGERARFDEKRRRIREMVDEALMGT